LTESDMHHARVGIGFRLWEARTAKGLSQAELGKKAGLNQAVVKQVENGMLKYPSVVSGLALALDVTPAWVQWGEPFSDKRGEQIPIRVGERIQKNSDSPCKADRQKISKKQ